MIIQTCGPEPEPEAMAQACRIAARWEGCNATIYVDDRTAEGWLQYGIDITRRDSVNSRAIYIALIQRTPGGAWEAHS